MSKRLSVLLSLCLCLCVKAEHAGKAALPKDYGVKLCGREFIRAVIFTCGGSRWRRSQDAEMLRDGGRNPVHLGTFIDSLNQLDEPTWSQNAELVLDPHLPSSSSHPFLADLFQLLGGSKVETEPEASEQQLMAGSGSWFGALSPSSLLEGAQSRSSRSLSSRRRSTFSSGLTGMCCTLGCTKNDIGRLC
ncbi:prorelaxin H1 [Denticeps clupeoides]|uniref:Insulin-like domain-containing protein n=1 Tax=Denticeps clupeoides TaxID=299321 RepID=A0AAY4DW77_9TELE|nr:relaxin-3-like [Denticeps clupeoides]